MERDEKKAAERLLYMEREIRAELDNLREILSLLGSSWQDAGALLMDKELRRHIQALEEQASELRRRGAALSAEAVPEAEGT